ncbi:gliding motility-associated C-terminal domain-containing protein, partial [Chitinophaga sp.]|uniref:T9SS type B sorting domain-containing protein n=1 Tax=Chitinophaga sp. TaxID=1869181 RepID=UPI002F94440C
FTITLQNQGPRAIVPGDTVIVKDQLPAGYNVTGFAPGAGKYDSTSGRWTGLNVAAGQNVTLLVNGTVATDYSGNSLTNKVSGLTPKKDSIPVENGGGATVTVEDSTDTVYHLKLSKKANSATAKAGGPLNFTITLQNQGPRAIVPGDTVIVKDQLPAGYNVTGFVPGAGKYDAASGRWTGLNVAAGQNVTLLVNGTVATDYSGNSLTNKVTGLTPNGDDIPLDNGGASTVEIEQDDLVVPNVITPNGDGVNDVLRIKGLEKYKDPELVIINRWNNLVYKKSNYDNTWNGSGLLEGTYFYVLTVKDNSGKVIIKRGYIMVLR